MITIERKQVLTYFISLMTFCFLMEATWAEDQLILSKTLGPLDIKPFASIRKNPKAFTVYSSSQPASVGWTSLSLASAVTPTTNFVFLSVYASAHEKNPEGEGFSSIGIRSWTGQSVWAWTRPVGHIYQNGLIYMDVADPAPLCLVLCPTNESQGIEYSYDFAPDNPGANLSYEFTITVLGYLEGEWQ